MTIVPLISLDLETTGLEPGRHAPWEIAWFTAMHRTDRAELIIADTAQAFLFFDAACDPAALEISRFWERYPHDASASTHWAVVQARLRNHLAVLRTRATPDVPVHLVGTCPQFDHRMLERWLGWNHDLWHYHLIDVETLLAGSHNLPPPYSTEQLTQIMEERLDLRWDRANQHEAGRDALWNLHLYAAAYGLRIRRYGAVT